MRSSAPAEELRPGGAAVVQDMRSKAGGGGRKFGTNPYEYAAHMHACVSLSAAAMKGLSSGEQSKGQDGIAV